METQQANHYIENKEQIADLLLSINGKEEFADSFAFASNELLEIFFRALGISRDEFERKFYYYDDTTGIHVSESQYGYFWISTIGLVSQGKLTNNHFVNAFSSQRWVIKTLLKAIDELCSHDMVYDIDSFFSEKVKEITPALFGNIVFFFELFGKAYLSINGKKLKKTHRLSVIYKDVEQTMFENNHNNTIFHASFMSSFKEMMKYISMLPNDFNEAFIKYDDNNDNTAIRLSHKMVKEWMDMVDTCYDFILDFYYCGNETFYLHTGFYDKLISKAESNEDKNRIREQYGFLIEKQEDTNHANP